MTEATRCTVCDRLLDTAEKLRVGSCCGGTKPGDVLLNPRTGYIFCAVSDGYGGVEFREFSPDPSHAQLCPPVDAVLLVRYVDGRPLPVLDVGSGDLFAVDVRRG